MAAEAEKTAAVDRAEAIRIAAEAEADKEKIAANGQAEAERLRAEGLEAVYTVEAAGKHAINEAQNTLSPEQIAMQVRLQLISQLPEIIAQSVKPMEQISDIKILQVDGLAGANGHAANGEGAAGGLADQAVNAALRYRGQAPLVDALMAELGLKAGDLSSLAATPASIKVDGDAD